MHEVVLVNQLVIRLQGRVLPSPRLASLSVLKISTAVHLPSTGLLASLSSASIRSKLRDCPLHTEFGRSEAVTFPTQHRLLRRAAHHGRPQQCLTVQIFGHVQPGPPG